VSTPHVRMIQLSGLCECWQNRYNRSLAQKKETEQRRNREVDHISPDEPKRIAGLLPRLALFVVAERHQNLRVLKVALRGRRVRTMPIRPAAFNGDQNEQKCSNNGSGRIRTERDPAGGLGKLLKPIENGIPRRKRRAGN
jgi:hypothetical protein